MNEKFTVTKLDSVWQCNYEDNEWLFQTLEDLCVFMEDHLYTLEEIKVNLFSYNNDKSIN